MTKFVLALSCVMAANAISTKKSDEVAESPEDITMLDVGDVQITVTRNRRGAKASTTPVLVTGPGGQVRNIKQGIAQKALEEMTNQGSTLAADELAALLEAMNGDTDSEDTETSD